MAFQYTRETVAGVSDDVFNEFYIYVDALVELLSFERLNPYTSVPYCPYNDPRFTMFPLREIVTNEEGGNVRKKYYWFQVEYSLPFKERLDPNPPTKQLISINVNLCLIFNGENQFIKSDFWVESSLLLEGIGIFEDRMSTEDLRSIDEIKDGLRIFLATWHNFFICPYDEDRQYEKRRLILDNYDYRHRKYMNYIKYSRLNHQEMWQTFLLRSNALVNSVPRDSLQSLRNPLYEYEDELMREVTSQGVS